jgi:endonuclease/exonuclease/phosphatase family metal-dependent hydrolase
MKIRLLSYNIQHCRDYMRSKKEGREIIDFDLIAQAIKSQNADIVVLNEVRDKGNHPDYTEQTKILAEKAGFEYFRFGEAIRLQPDLPYGNALLSKYPIAGFDVIKIPDPAVKDENAYYETRCIMRAKIKTGEKYITVFGTHFGLANSEQKNAANTVITLLDRCDVPHVLMGDFNMEPDNEKLQPIYERLTDTAEYFKEAKLSFPSDNPNRKIDFIFVSKDLKVTYADIPDIIASDHRMVVADIEIV